MQSGIFFFKEIELDNPNKSYVIRIVCLQDYLILVLWKNGIYELFDLNINKKLLDGQIPEEIMLEPTPEI